MATKFDNRQLEDDDEGDLSDDLNLSIRLIENVGVWPSDWTTETIISQIDKKNINLDPKFQRRSVWSPEKQSRFIESLLLGIPVPQLVLAEGKKRGDPFIIIDGKQRLLAMKNFASRVNKDESSKLRLSGLKMLRTLNRKTYKDMAKNEKFMPFAMAFDNTSVRTIIIRHWENENFLHETFWRINTGSVRLSPQELRQALYPGDFSKYILYRSAKSEQLRLVLNKDGPDDRMRDAELLLRYISYKNFISDYKGNLKAFLDKTTKILNKNWKNEKEKTEFQVVQMEEAFKFTRRIFRENYMCKWNGVDSYEDKRNKAVIDIMLHYFSCPEVRNSLKSHTKEIKKAFEDLCCNEEFRRSFERSTKNMKTNRARFNMWGDAVGEIAKMNLDHMKLNP